MNFVFDSNVDALKQVHVYTRQGERELTSESLPGELENRVGKDACWKVLLMCFLVI